MTYRMNDSAIGTYRTLEGDGLGGCFDKHTDQVGELGGAEYYRPGTPGQWDNFRGDPSGYAAYDSVGHSWRVSEAEAAEIGLREPERK